MEPISLRQDKMVTSLTALVGISCAKSLSQVAGLSKRIPLLPLLLAFVRWRLGRKTDSLIYKMFYCFDGRSLCQSCAATILCQVEADQGAQKTCHAIQRQYSKINIRCFRHSGVVGAIGPQPFCQPLNCLLCCIENRLGRLDISCSSLALRLCTLFADIPPLEATVQMEFSVKLCWLRPGFTLCSSLQMDDYALVEVDFYDFDTGKDMPRMYGPQIAFHCSFHCCGIAISLQIHIEQFWVTPGDFKGSGRGVRRTIMETFAPAPVERCGAGVSCKRPADYGSPTTVEMTLDATNCRGDQLKGLKRPEIC